jgi:hypothetical protein
VCGAGIAQSVWRLATGWTVRGSNPCGGEIFRTRPDRPCGPPGPLYNGHLLFPVGNAAGFKERVELYTSSVPLGCCRVNFTFTVMHLFHCRNLTLHWTRGRFHPSSDYLHYRPHVHYRRHLTHLNTPERRFTTIPVVLPLCYAPHVTEPHKRKKFPVLHGRYYGVHLTPSGNKHK